MVYCGKPSRACSHCKTRQAKCDRKPECGQCRRAGLKCPGPRDPKQLVFRDQSQEVSRKVATRSSNFISPKRIGPTVLEQAKAVFFDRYVNGNSRTYDYISSLISTTDGDSCLPDAIDAVSLAYLSTQDYSANVLRSARENYGLALRMVGEALQSRDQAAKDSTLVSVLLLDLFEKLTRTQRSSESWTKHMHGAIELVKLRGDSQFQHPLGLRLFLQLNSTILIGCVQHDVQVPIDLINLRREANGYVHPTDPKWKFSEIVVQFVGFRVAMREDRLSRTELLDTATHLDAALGIISENVPPEWKYDTIMVHSPCQQVYGDHFHVYADHHTTHTWNNIRIIRILLNELIREHYLSQTKSVETFATLCRDVEDHVAHISDRIVSLSTDILASVPQYAQLPRHMKSSFTTNPSIDTLDHSSSTTRQNSRSDPPRIPTSTPKPVKIEPRDFTPFETSRCYSLIFPLYVAGSSEVCPDSMQEWILSMLDFLEKFVGIKEAVVAAGYLKRREKINPWSLYAMIGSYSFSA